HVPELRQYQASAKKLQGEIAWDEAQALLREKYPGKSMELAVGLRGISLYGPILVGRVLPKESETEDGVTFSDEGSGAQQKLYPFFVPEATAQPGDEKARK